MRQKNEPKLEIVESSLLHRAARRINQDAEAIRFLSREAEAVRKQRDELQVEMEKIKKAAL